MSSYRAPHEIIDFCLKPLGLDPASEASKEAVRRLEHVIKTFQLAVVRSGAAQVAVDFSKMPTITINESAHGHE